MNTKENNFYSQWGQDEFVLSILGPKREGYFVDIGAFDGVTISNTFYFENVLNWKGICIEPNPHTYNQLKEKRNCLCLNLAVAPYKKDVEILLNGWSSAINDDFTSSEILKENHESVLIEGITINELFELHNVPLYFDYLSIDIEGGELDILKTLDFNRWRFGILTYEHNAHLVNHENHDKLVARKKEMEDLLLSNDYKFIKDYEGDGFFADKNLI